MSKLHSPISNATWIAIHINQIIVELKISNFGCQLPLTEVFTKCEYLFYSEWVFWIQNIIYIAKKFRKLFLEIIIIIVFFLFS